MFVLFLVVCSVASPAPLHYFRFNSFADAQKSETSAATIGYRYGFAFDASVWHSDGAGGGYLEWTRALRSQGAIQDVLGPANPAGDATIEFLCRFNRDTLYYAAASGGYGSPLLMQLGDNALRISNKELKVSGDAAIGLKLDGADRLSLSHYVNFTQWHHFALRVSSTASDLWVDGVKLASGSGASGATQPLRFSSMTPYHEFNGAMDELAVYDAWLDDATLVRHDADARLLRQAYTTTERAVTPPSAPATFDVPLASDDFAPGTVLGSGESGVKQTEGVSMLAIDQLRAFPVPRYYPYTSLSWLEPGYDLNHVTKDPTVVTHEQRVANIVDIATTLALKYRYSFQLGGQFTFDVYSEDRYVGCGWGCRVSYNITQLARMYPHVPLSLWTLRAQMGTKLVAQNNDVSGCVFDGKLRPTSVRNQASVCPDATFAADGERVRTAVQWINDALAGSGRGINGWAGENGEFWSPYSESGLLSDPVVAADMAVGGEDWKTYLTNWRLRVSLQFRDAFLPYAQLEGRYAEYYVDGKDLPYGIYPWRIMRELQTTGYRGSRYGAGDMYVRTWKDTVGSFNGIDNFLSIRQTEMKQFPADRFFHPHVTAGWSIEEELNMRPGQWLGLLKLLTALGAETMHAWVFFIDYQGRFEFNAHPRNCVWQAAQASYAHAVTSRWAAEFMFDGELLVGDTPSYSAGSELGYLHQTGDPRCMVLVRRSNANAHRFVVVTAGPMPWQRGGGGGALERSKAISFDLDGARWTLTTRRQGAVYVLDNAAPDAPTVTQLDAWHEPTHPAYWSTTSLEFEAEVDDANATTPRALTTVRGADAASTHDFTSFTTYVTLGAGDAPLVYALAGAPAGSFALWLRARAVSADAAAQLEISIDGGVLDAMTTTVDAASSSPFAYCAVPLAAASIALDGDLTRATSMRVTAVAGDVTIDRVLLLAAGALPSGVDAYRECGSDAPPSDEAESPSADAGSGASPSAADNALSDDAPSDILTLLPYVGFGALGLSLLCAALACVVVFARRRRRALHDRRALGGGGGGGGSSGGSRRSRSNSRAAATRSMTGSADRSYRASGTFVGGGGGGGGFGGLHRSTDRSHRSSVTFASRPPLTFSTQSSTYSNLPIYR